ncbi:MAG: flavodoxin family protein [Erysipelotrichaceae bacterium]|nr:flavodoxin family protein [Erysipelotrichaceae bacterium]
MNLLIHDLSDEDLKKIIADPEDYTIVSDNDTIRPCVGCFGCWNKDPGRCVVKDGYENMGYLIHHADEVFVVSRYTYGGFSGFVKNVFDRCLAYVLPHFELVNGQSHHKRRYDEDKAFTFIFYGDDLSAEDKEDAKRYVQAVCINIRGHVKEVRFIDSPEEKGVRLTDEETIDKAVFINASMRGNLSNTARLSKEVTKLLNKENETIYLSAYLNKMSELVKQLKDVSTLVLCAPLYVDGLPSQMIRLLETFEKEYEGPSKKIYVLANMGLYESDQLVNLFAAFKKWSDKLGFEYQGGLGIAAGELVGGLMALRSIDQWPLKEVGEGIRQLSEAINYDGKIQDLYTGPIRFPRFLYIAIANSGWQRTGKKNGLKKEDLFRKL